MQMEKLKLEDIRAEGYQILSNAKSEAGIFSIIGVDEVKNSFWSYFNKGKAFAKRQTMYDAIFSGIRSMSRDESMGEYMLKMAMQAMFNLSIGLIGCLITFTFALYSIVKSYQPDPLTFAAFFFCAFAAAFATVSSVIVGMFGGAGAAVFGVLKVVELQQLEGGGGGGGGGQDYRRNLRD
jgi:hypothetical protein